MMTQERRPRPTLDVGVSEENAPSGDGDRVPAIDSGGHVSETSAPSSDGDRRRTAQTKWPRTWSRKQALRAAMVTTRPDAGSEAEPLQSRKNALRAAMVTHRPR
jgi:hypothetical protein